MPDTEDFSKRSTIPTGKSDSKEDAAFTPHTPKFIGPYQIECFLEKGGMSLLYLGTHPETKEPTTIKVLLPKYSQNKEVVDRFLKEAEIIALADHPNIVKLYGHGEWEGGLYIAMEFIQGISLRQYLLQTPLSLKRSLEILLDIAYALCHLHTHGVIHRDLKPENVLITESNEVKLIDFGIAQLLTEQTRAASGMIGTPIYMSPEQRENPASVSYPSDIYSLGIVAYELILGKLSHGQIQLSLVPKGLQKFLAKALQQNPQDRYQDAVDFIADISSYLTSDSVEKEKNVGDHITEISENIRQAQGLLVSTKLPEWKKVELGFSLHRNAAISGVYLDFIDLPQGLYGIVMGESSNRDVLGFIDVAMIRGMFMALCHTAQSPVEHIQILNTLILKEMPAHIVTLSYLILDPMQEQLHYFSCGYGYLWQYPADTKVLNKITTENIALGIDKDSHFAGITQPWKPGDVLLLTNFAGLLSRPDLGDFFSEEHLVQALSKSLTLSPPKLVESVMRSIKSAAPKAIRDRFISLIAIKHLG